MAKILFNEVQTFRHNLLWSCVLIIPAVVMLSLFIYQLASGTLVGDRPMSNLSLGILCICYIVPVCLIFPYVNLTLIIDEQKITYGWNVPIKDYNVIEISNIKEWSVIKYRFVGYGYRISRLYGNVYNLSGNKGLQIITKNDEKVLIGTLHPEQLKEVIEKIRL